MSDSFIKFVLWEIIICLIIYLAVSTRELNQKIRELEKNSKK